MSKIHFIRHSWAVRTKGAMVCAGLDVQHKDGMLHITPLTAQHELGTTMMGIPASEALGVAVALLKEAGAAIRFTIEDGRIGLATPEAWDVMRVLNIDTDTDGHDPSEVTTLMQPNGELRDCIVTETELPITTYEEYPHE